MAVIRIKISFHRQTLEVLSKNWWGKPGTKIYGFNELDFTYRRRYVGRYRRIFHDTPPGGRLNVLFIDTTEKTIAELEPGADGWTDERNRAVALDLQMAGIKRITEKYNDNEVAL
jgi:hypothetical protein